MFIYVIVCSETLKIYVGQHKGPNLSWYLTRKWWDANHHTSGTRSHLYNAMRQHPRESWSIHSLVSDIESRPELDVLEQHYIQALNARHPDVGYNICRGGEGFTGPHTDAWRKETLERVQAYWANPEHREQRSQNMKARWLNPAFQQSQVNWKAANPEKMAYWKGKTRSEESKRKASESEKGQQHRLGQKQSPEERAKKSASLLRYHARKRQQQQDFSIHK